MKMTEGDIVVLKSGSPEMTVVVATDHGVSCAFWDEGRGLITINGVGPGAFNVVKKTEPEPEEETVPMQAMGGPLNGRSIQMLKDSAHTDFPAARKGRAVVDRYMLLENGGTLRAVYSNTYARDASGNPTDEVV